jgi:hypothetical protein
MKYEKQSVDVCNYLAITLLENLGVDAPLQAEIDVIEQALQRALRLVKKRHGKAFGAVSTH